MRWVVGKPRYYLVRAADLTGSEFDFGSIYWFLYRAFCRIVSPYEISTYFPSSFLRSSLYSRSRRSSSAVSSP